MKKILLSIAVSLVLPAFVFAYFQPATLTNGIKRVAVYTQEEASKLFADGFVLEEKVGALSGDTVTFNMKFLGQVKMKDAVKTYNFTGATSTVTLKTEDSGTTFYLAGTGTPITLPAVAKSAGVHYTFVIGGAAGVENFVIDSAEGDNIEGSLIVAGAVVDCDAEDQLDFVVDGENLGDYVELYSNGTNWFIGDSGVLTSGKMTCTDPS